jgi:threonine/homoserine efflux transporter RhtA
LVLGQALAGVTAAGITLVVVASAGTTLASRARPRRAPST